MEETFVLEFSENQQCFHHNYGNHKIGSNNYAPIDLKCTYDKSKAFCDYMENITHYPMTLDFVKECYREFMIKA